MWSFHVIVLQRMKKKCTKNYNARAQPLFCSLNLLLSDVPAALAVDVFLNSICKTYDLMNVDVLVVLPHVSVELSNLRAEILGRQNKPFPG